MAVFQTTWWVCDYCGAHEVKTDMPVPYDIPRIAPPSRKEWGYIDPQKPGVRHRLACPDCLEKGLFNMFQQMEKACPPGQ